MNAKLAACTADIDVNEVESYAKIEALVFGAETGEEAAEGCRLEAEWLSIHGPRETGDAWSGGFAENH